jgi:hypothetical protein
MLTRQQMRWTPRGAHLFDEAGPENVAMAAGLRPTAKAVDWPPEPKVRAPVLDPTCEGLTVQSRWATHPRVARRQAFKIWQEATYACTVA